MNIVVKNMNLYLIMRSFVVIAEALVTIITLGFVCPGWSLDLGVWRLRRQLANRKKRRGRQHRDSENADREELY